jgi:hypothetical protein
MKKVILFSLVVLASSAFGQRYKNSKYWSSALNFGGQALFNSTVESVKFYQPSSIHVNAIYKFNPIWGIRPNVNFHRLIMEEKPHTKYIGALLDVVVDFNQMETYGFIENQYEFSVLGYTGFGFSSMWTRRKDYMDGDKYILGNDDMISFNIGMTPRMRISRNMLLNFDFGFVAHFLKDRNYDFVVNKDRKEIVGNGFVRYSIGITYEFVK